ncbi:DUF3139 domain-containing protein [Pontibacillus yanchengensis]|uniref:DUF3139 domain-containing protein n=1 Tax=Pontibacillus yanchengensis Y32 TaxID=1385514 RepID=A0A0A2TG95_9BACI|nr:DUF3139 domain-containing protein [Pontibacillus yanchengensis]KGP74584.1 hypothetical protein N782_00475 [Pontibacillus yanchengensis Y32]
MKTVKRVAYSIIIIISVLVVAAIIYVQVKKNMLQSEVEEYLSQKGHSKDVLQEVDPSFGVLPYFAVTVTFKNEPEATYSYTREDGQIVQLDCEHNDPNAEENYEFKHCEN